MKTKLFFIAICAGYFFLIPANAQNILKNSSFDIPNQQGPVSSFTRTQQHVGGGPSGAANWTTWANTFHSTIETEWMPSTLTGGHMLRVSTNGLGNGIVQVTGPLNSGPREATACVWIFIERGEVGIGVGNGGNTHTSMTLTEPGKWERIMVSNAVSPANEIIIYSTHPEGADFYIESAEMQAGPTQEVECCRPG